MRAKAVIEMPCLRAIPSMLSPGSTMWTLSAFCGGIDACRAGCGGVCGAAMWAPLAET